MSKFTPGPWEYVALPDDSFEIRLDNGAWLLRCTSASDPTIEEREEDEANVRMAAAAPELLKALHALLHSSGIDARASAQMQAHAAIYKATGGVA